MDIDEEWTEIQKNRSTAPIAHQLAASYMERRFLLQYRFTTKPHQEFNAPLNNQPVAQS